MEFTKYFQKLKSSEHINPTDHPNLQPQLQNAEPYATNAAQDKGSETNVAHEKGNTTNAAHGKSNEKEKQMLASENLSKIKHLIEQPKEDNPELRFNEIKDNLLTEETYYQTLREERWHPTVYCPNCHSTDIQILTKEQQTTPHNYRYLCLMCRTRFNDDSKTPFEFKAPHIDIWIQCWFLLGCTDSLEYIAAKLNLDINTVKQMVQALQDTFKVKQPLTRTMSYDEWSSQYAQTYSKRIKAEIINRKRKEIHQGMATSQPQDTAEVRRQKNKKPPPKNKNFT